MENCTNSSDRRSSSTASATILEQLGYLPPSDDTGAGDRRRPHAAAALQRDGPRRGGVPAPGHVARPHRAGTLGVRRRCSSSSRARPTTRCRRRSPPGRCKEVLAETVHLWGELVGFEAEDGRSSPKRSPTRLRVGGVPVGQRRAPRVGAARRRAHRRRLRWLCKQLADLLGQDRRRRRLVGHPEGAGAGADGPAAAVDAVQTRRGVVLAGLRRPRRRCRGARMDAGPAAGLVGQRMRAQASSRGRTATDRPVIAHGRFPVTRDRRYAPVRREDVVDAVGEPVGRVVEDPRPLVHERGAHGSSRCTRTRPRCQPGLARTQRRTPTMFWSSACSADRCGMSVHMSGRAFMPLTSTTGMGTPAGRRRASIAPRVAHLVLDASVRDAPRPEVRVDEPEGAPDGTAITSTWAQPAGHRDLHAVHRDGGWPPGRCAPRRLRCAGAVPTTPHQDWPL